MMEMLPKVEAVDEGARMTSYTGDPSVRLGSIYAPSATWAISPYGPTEEELRKEYMGDWTQPLKTVEEVYGSKDSQREYVERIRFASSRGEADRILKEKKDKEERMDKYLMRLVIEMGLTVEQVEEINLIRGECSWSERVMLWILAHEVRDNGLSLKALGYKPAKE